MSQQDAGGKVDFSVKLLDRDGYVGAIDDVTAASEWWGDEEFVSKVGYRDIG